MKRFIAGVLAVGALLLAAGAAQAGTITSLYSTGVDNGGSLLPNGAIDPHYRLNVGPSAPSAFVIGNPAGVGWVGNTPGSQWISPARDTRGGPGPFIYTTRFDLTGFIPGTARITGLWSADNESRMFLNGNLVAVNPFQGWTDLDPFSINTGFVSGLNTLRFVVPNARQSPNDGPTGLQVRIRSATAAAVPLPPAALLGLGLLGGLGLIGHLRKRRSM